MAFDHAKHLSGSNQFGGNFPLCRPSSARGRFELIDDHGLGMVAWEQRPSAALTATQGDKFSWRDLLCGVAGAGRVTPHRAAIHPLSPFRVITTRKPLTQTLDLSQPHAGKMHCNFPVVTVYKW